VLLRHDEVHGEEELAEALAELGEYLFVGLAQGDAVELDAAGGGEGEVVLQEVWLGWEDGFCLGASVRGIVSMGQTEDMEGEEKAGKHAIIRETTEKPNRWQK
jgi:hypothetical protein